MPPVAVATDGLGIVVGLVNSVGVPISVALILGWFLYKALWPFLTKQIEDATKERRELLKELTVVLAQHTASSQQLVYSQERPQSDMDDLLDRKRHSTPPFHTHP